MKRWRALVVGEAPSETNDAGRVGYGRDARSVEEGKRGPFDGPGGTLLAALTETDLTTWLETYDRVNLMHCWDEAKDWDVHHARRRAKQVWAEIRDGGYVEVVFCGVKVATAMWQTRPSQKGVSQEKPPPLLAFCRIDVPLRGTRDSVRQILVWCSPHPSLRSRWWNSEENRENAALWWKDAAKRARDRRQKRREDRKLHGN